MPTLEEKQARLELLKKQRRLEELKAQRAEMSATAAAPKPAAPQPKEQGFFNKLGTGFTRLPALVGLNKDISPGEAWEKVGTGAAEGLMATTRGFLGEGGVFGKTGEDLLVNAPLAAIGSVVDPERGGFQQQFEGARAQGKRLAKEQPVGKFAGNVGSFVTAGGAVRNALPAAWGTGTKLMTEGAVLGGASALADRRPEDVARDVAIGAAIGRVTEPVSQIVGKGLSAGAQKAGSIINAIRGKPQAGPLTEKTVRSIANRTQSNAKDIQEAYDEFAKYNPGQAASFAEIADTATIDRFADMARLRRSVGDDKMGAIYRDFEDKAALARPGNIRAGIEATGPTEFASNVRAGLDEGADAATQAVGDARVAEIRGVEAEKAQQFGKIDEFTDARIAARNEARVAEADNIKLSRDARIAEINKAADAQIAARRDITVEESDAIKLARDQKIDEINQSSSAQTQALDDAARIEREQLKSSIDLDDDINDWSAETLRASGLADKTVTLKPSVFKSVISKEVALPIFQKMVDSLPEKSRGPLNRAIKAITENKESLASVSDLDVLRRALKSISQKTPETIKLSSSADTLTDIIEKQAPGYRAFLNNYRLAQEAATGFAKFNSAFGNTPDIMRFGAQVAEAKQQVIQALGPRGEAIVEAVENSMTKLSKMADEIEAIKAAAKASKAAAKAESVGAVRGAAKAEQVDITAIEDASAAAKAAAKSAAVMASRESTKAFDDSIIAIKASGAKAKDVTQADADAAIEAVKKMAEKEIARITKVLSGNKEAVEAVDKILSRTTGRFQAAISRATDNMPLGNIARGSIADAAGESIPGAIKTARTLSEGAVGKRLESVMSPEEADAITGIGRTQYKAAKNVSALPTERPSETVIPAPGALALDAIGGAAGRPGPGYKVQFFKKSVQFFSQFGIRGDKAKALAEAVVTQDDAAIRQIIKGIDKNQKNVEQAVNQVRGAFQAGRQIATDEAVSASEREKVLSDLVANGYTLREARELMAMTDALDQ